MRPQRSWRAACPSATRRPPPSWPSRENNKPPADRRPGKQRGHRHRGAPVRRLPGRRGTSRAADRPADHQGRLRTADAAMHAAAEMIRLPGPPTALFASQDLVTAGAVKAPRRAGVQERIALAGFDDFTLAGILTPGLTVITHDAAQFGRLSAQLLSARLNRGNCR